MGNTLDTMRGGSARLLFTALVEGYRYILTNAPADAALAAHPGTEHVGALDGLYVDLENEQSLNPWDPFPSGGRCRLTIVPDADDTFGIDTHKRDTGAATTLAAAIDRNDTTITVKATAGFASSGDIHIGTECISYTGKTATTFTGCTRGKYEILGGFTEHHRVGYVDSGPKLEPVVTEFPRTWIGKWVTVYAHAVASGSDTLDVRNEAQLVFAGRINAISDDAASGGTVIELKHVLDCIRDQTVGRELWTGRLGAGVYLDVGDIFTMTDHDGATREIANDLVVVASGASTSNEMNAGFYTHEQLQTSLNTWWQSERDASRLHGTYTLSASAANGGIRSKIFWEITAASTNVGTQFRFQMPLSVRDYLGFTQAGQASSSLMSLYGYGFGNTEQAETANAPIKLIVFTELGVGGYIRKAQIIEERGQFIDNLAFLPAGHGIKPPTPIVGAEYGLFLVDDKILIRAAKIGDQLQNIYPIQIKLAGIEPVANSLAYEFEATVDNISSVSVRQILTLEMPLAHALSYFFYSTGTSGYNDLLYDVLDYGLGIGIPGPLLGRATIFGQEFINSAQSLPSAFAPILIVIDKPTKLVDVFAGDLVIRNAFLRWIDGHLEFCQWRTPLSGKATIALSESNKAAPSGTKDDQRTATRESTQWQRSIVKILYNRDISEMSNDGGYRSSITLEDRVAIDDAGGEGKVASVKCRNTYGQYAGTGTGVEELAPGFLSIWPVFGSRPVRLLSRPIDLTNFEGMSIGDCVTVSDAFARDPDTGTRGISVRPAIVARHWYSLGGRQAEGRNPAPMAGGVELLLLDAIRMKPYAPAAQVNDTVVTMGGFSGGYDDTTNTIRCYANKYSEASEPADASYFAANYEVVIMEIDPADPANPQKWSRTVLSVSGNDIVLAGSTLAGWDGNKKYRVVFEQYDSGPDAQRLFAYQGDDATGKIIDDFAPDQYAAGWASLFYTANSSSDPVELPPNVVSEDGQGRDVAHDLAIGRLLTNLEDYKLTVQAPMLLATASSNVDYAQYKLVQVRPFFLSEAGLSTSIRRELTVAPFMRSTDGTSASVRVTLASRFPSGDGALGLLDVDRGSGYVEAVFTSTNTTWHTATSAVLDIGGVKPADGICWLLVEVHYKTETRGLAICVEGPRTA